MIVNSVLLLLLVWGNVQVSRWYFKRAIPAAKVSLENRYGVKIDHNIGSVWRVALDEPPELRSKYEFRVATYQFLLMFAFVAAILLQILLIYLGARFLTSQSD